MSPKSTLKALLTRSKRVGKAHGAPQPTTESSAHDRYTDDYDPATVPPTSADTPLTPPKLRLETNFLHASGPSPGSTTSSDRSASGTPRKSTSQLGSAQEIQGQLDVKTSPTGSSVLFQNASNFHIDKFHVENGNREAPGWTTLRKHIAADALYDSAARFDAPKCDEDTRVEVLAEIMGWAKDPERPQALLCITGPAGSGKSAIMQTVCTTLDSDEQPARILAASFFFSATDPSRNIMAPVVGTIAFQLALASPILRTAISTAVENNPLIFTKPIEKQLITLIIEPYIHNRHLLAPDTPYLIIIDGLDECNDEERQDELLRAIRQCLAGVDIPFRFIVASRPEWAIFSALQPNGHLEGSSYHIELNNGYDARLDIERYLRRRFSALGITIGMEVGWPGEHIIQKLAINASGQFIYAATVMKYVTERRASPLDRLQAVMSWAPGSVSRSRPFAGLDALYTAILSNAQENFKNIDDNEHDLVLLLQTLVQLWQDLPFARRRWLKPDWGQFLCLPGGTINGLVVDLRSLASVSTSSKSTETLIFYHKSFLDFLRDPSRSANLFKPVEEVEGLVIHFAYRHISNYLRKTSPRPSSHVFEVSVETLAIFVEQGIESSDTTSAAVTIDIARQFTKLKLWSEVLRRRRVPDTVNTRREYLSRIAAFLSNDCKKSRLGCELRKEIECLSSTTRVTQTDGYPLSSSSSRPSMSRAIALPSEHDG